MTHTTRHNAPYRRMPRAAVITAAAALLGAGALVGAASGQASRPEPPSPCDLVERRPASPT